MRMRIRRKAYQWYYKLYCNIALILCTSPFVHYRWPLIQCRKQQNQDGNGLDHNGFPKGFSLTLPLLFLAWFDFPPFLYKCKWLGTNGFRYNGSHWLNDSTHMALGKIIFQLKKMFMSSFYRANVLWLICLRKQTSISHVDLHSKKHSLQHILPSYSEWLTDFSNIYTWIIILGLTQ